MREAVHWTTPSSSAPSVELYTGSERMLFAANAANSQVAERRSYAKLRSGLLFPNKRYPGWTVEHVRRPTLDEATTLVAQLESCEAGLGRTVMGPTTPKKQRVAPQAAVLAHWERVGEFADNEKPRDAAFRPAAVEVVGGVWAQRSVGVKAHPQGW